MYGNTPPSVIELTDLGRLFDALKQQGYQLLGPTIQEAAIVYDEIKQIQDLPIGWSDEQFGGCYRLKKRNDNALFGYHIGPHNWKKYLFPPRHNLWQTDREGQSIMIKPIPIQSPKRALIGVRACALAAIKIQDQVLLGGAVIDPHYQAHRESLFIVAVNCGQAENTCFCESMQTGPTATEGFDLALTEVLSKHRHYFVVQVGSTAGLVILNQIPHQPATQFEQATAQRVIEHTAQTMGRSLATKRLKEKLYNNLEHSQWEIVADRCLSCANCAMACPTCFCSIATI